MSDVVKRFTRIVIDAAGGSAFQDDEFPLDSPPGVMGMLTGTVPAVRQRSLVSVAVVTDLVTHRHRDAMAVATA